LAQRIAPSDSVQASRRSAAGIEGLQNPSSRRLRGCRGALPGLRRTPGSKPPCTSSSNGSQDDLPKTFLLCGALFDYVQCSVSFVLANFWQIGPTLRCILAKNPLKNQGFSHHPLCIEEEMGPNAPFAGWQAVTPGP